MSKGVIPPLRKDMRDEVERTLEQGGYISAKEFAEIVLGWEARLYRRKRIKKSPAKSRKMTKELAAKIKKYTLTHLNESNQSIAIRFGVNSGRVSDSTRGYADGSPAFGLEK